MREEITKQIGESIAIKQELMSRQATVEAIAEFAGQCVRTFNQQGKIMLAGNGGSAADAQHIAAEFVGRFELERSALPAIALNVNTSILTAVANDYDYAEVFRRQVMALAREEDLFVAISTSGNSLNVLKAVDECRARGVRTVGLTGQGGGKLSELCDLMIMVPSRNTARIQESHIMIMHVVCSLVEKSLFKGAV